MSMCTSGCICARRILYVLSLKLFLGSPIHQHLSDRTKQPPPTPDSSTSPIHQYYPSIGDIPDYHGYKISSAAEQQPYGLPSSTSPVDPSAYHHQHHHHYHHHYGSGSPLHSASVSPFASTGSNLGSPIHATNIYGLLSPNGSPVFGVGVGQPTSVSSITQG